MKKVSMFVAIIVLIIIGIVIKNNDAGSSTSDSNVNMETTKKVISQDVKREIKPKKIMTPKIAPLDDSKQNDIFKVEPESVRQLQQRSVEDLNDKILDYNDYLHDPVERKNIQKSLEVQQKEFKSSSLYLAKKALEDESKKINY